MITNANGWLAPHAQKRHLEKCKSYKGTTPAHTLARGRSALRVTGLAVTAERARRVLTGAVCIARGRGALVDVCGTISSFEATLTRRAPSRWVTCRVWSRTVAQLHTLCAPLAIRALCKWTRDVNTACNSHFVVRWALRYWSFMISIISSGFNYANSEILWENKRLPI